MISETFKTENYKSYGFIQIGRTGAMFTLRKTYLQFIGKEYQEWSDYIQNLGTTPNESYNKAEILCKKMGIQLRTTKENLAEELRKINRSKRKTPEEIEEERIICCFENNMLKHDYIDYSIMYDIMSGIYSYKITSNIIPFGKHRGKSFNEINLLDRPYLEWMADQKEEDSNIWIFKIQTFINNNNSPLEINEYIGNIKERQEFEVFIKSIRYFDTDYGTSSLITMRTEKGNILISWYSGSKLELKEGESYKIKGTVKEHKEYRNVKQTIINRISLST